MPISQNTISAIQERLSADLTRHPSIKRVLDQLPRLLHAGSNPIAIRKAWDGISQDLRRLSRDSNLLDASLLEALENEVVTQAAIPKEVELEAVNGVVDQIIEKERDIAYILFPSLPLKHREAINVAFTTRALALYPQRVLPPGKSLISLFMSDTPYDNREDREAMLPSETDTDDWDMALMQLSTPEPDIQMPRIKALYHDLYEALRPFVKSTHPLMIALNLPMSPSTNPLITALSYLRASLALLRTMCGSRRERSIDQVVKSIDDADKLHMSQKELADAYIVGVKFALNMSQTMVDDRHAAMARYGDETNIKAVLRGTAKENERDALIAAFGKDGLRQSWEEWTESLSGPHAWTARLVDIVGALDSVMWHPEPLPPLLQMYRLDLAEAQSFFLGVIIAASIRSLVPALPTGRLTMLHHGDQDALDTETHFTERLWTIIGADPFNKVEETKESDLDNMAAEVVRVWKLRNPNATDIAAKEKEMSEMVKKMVNDENHPVRVLLKKRVVDALKERLTQPMATKQSSIPSKVASGGIKQGPRFKTGKPFVWDQPETDLVVLGFTDSVIKKYLMQVLHILRIVEGWVEYVWDDII